MTNAKTIFGAIIIIIGILMLLNQFGINVNVGSYWPIFILIPGLFFWVLFFNRKDRKGSYGLLIPGTILLIYGVYFFFNIWTNDKFWAETSFIFPLGVGLSFFIAYYFSEKRVKGLLIPAWILTGAAVITLLSTSLTNIWGPIVIILFGAYLLYKQGTEKKKDNLEEDSSNEKNTNNI